MNRLIAIALLLLPGSAFAARGILNLQAQPEVVFLNESTKVTFTATLIGNEGPLPETIHVMRLEHTGNESQLCLLEPVKGSSETYRCSVSLKESNPGLLGLTAQAIYPDSPDPLRSRSLFMNIVGGLRAKDRKAMLKIHDQATKRYHEMAKEKTIEQSKRETISWLLKQPGVIAAGRAPKDELFVQFETGVRMAILPPGTPEKTN
jgi:hypothetical protein